MGATIGTRGTLLRTVSVATIVAFGLAGGVSAAPIIGTNGSDGTNGDSTTVGVGGDGANNAGSGGAGQSSGTATAGTAGTAGTGGGGGGAGKDYGSSAANGADGGNGEFGTGGKGGTITRAAGGGGDEAGGGGGFGASVGASAGGGGGGGGGRGLTISTLDGTILVVDPVTGGVGGDGGSGDGNSYADGGGGGGGGIGVVFSGAGVLTVSGAATGGKGGTGGDGSQTPFGVNSGSYGGSGGAGGTGLRLSGGGTVLVDAAVTGGDGGARGASIQVPTKSTHGAGGTGIAGADIDVVLRDGGSISGGLGGDGTTRGKAVAFTGTTNSFELQIDASNVIGTVDGGGTADTFKLGGTATGMSFDTSLLGTQFTGFEAFGKVGSGSWTLTGTPGVAALWSVTDGTLILPGTMKTDIETSGTGTFELDGGTLDGTLDNAGKTLAEGTITGAIDNQAGGTFRLTGNLVASASFTNSGRLEAFGTGAPASFSVSGGTGFASHGTITLSQAGAYAGDTLDLTGAGTFDAGTMGQLYVDVDLTSFATAATDTLLLGETDGTLEVNFSTDPARYGALTPNLLVVATSDGTLSATATGLQSVGLVDYTFEQIGTDWYIVSHFSVAPLGGMAAGVASAGRVVDVATRPAALDEPATCRAGVHGRVDGGGLAATASASAGGGAATDLDVDTRYGGAQIGVDSGCFALGEAATARVGVIGGVTSGRSALSQALQAGVALEATTDFTAYYAGLYAEVSAGGWLANGRLGVDTTDFGMNADLVSGPGTVIDAQSTNTGRLTAAASLGYAIALDDVVVTPTLGLAYAHSRTGSVQLVDLGGELSFADRDSWTGSGGIELSKSVTLADDTGQLRYFVSGTLYREFGDAQVATYTDSINAPVSTTTALAEAYGVLSAGVSFEGPASAGGAGQSASLRGDLSYGGGEVGTRVSGAYGVKF